MMRMCVSTVNLFVLLFLLLLSRPHSTSSQRTQLYFTPEDVLRQVNASWSFSYPSSHGSFVTLPSSSEVPNGYGTFDGFTQYINLNDPNDNLGASTFTTLPMIGGTSNGGGFTIAMWLNLAELHEENRIVTISQNLLTYAHAIIVRIINGELGMILGGTSGQICSLQNSFPLTTRSWNHYVWMFDVSNNNMLRTYVNGKFMTTVTCTSYPEYVTRTTAYLMRSDSTNNLNQFTSGSLNLFQLFLTPLADNEVTLIADYGTQAWRDTRWNIYPSLESINGSYVCPTCSLTFLISPTIFFDLNLPLRLTIMSPTFGSRIQPSNLNWGTIGSIPPNNLTFTFYPPSLSNSMVGLGTNLPVSFNHSGSGNRPFLKSLPNIWFWTSDVDRIEFHIPTGPSMTLLKLLPNFHPTRHDYLLQPEVITSANFEVSVWFSTIGSVSINFIYPLEGNGLKYDVKNGTDITIPLYLGLNVLQVTSTKDGTFRFNVTRLATNLKNFTLITQPSDTFFPPQSSTLITTTPSTTIGGIFLYRASVPYIISQFRIRIVSETSDTSKLINPFNHDQFLTLSNDIQLGPYDLGVNTFEGWNTLIIMNTFDVYNYTVYLTRRIQDLKAIRIVDRTMIQQVNMLNTTNRTSVTNVTSLTYGSYLTLSPSNMKSGQFDFNLTLPFLISSFAIILDYEGGSNVTTQLWNSGHTNMFHNFMKGLPSPTLNIPVTAPSTTRPDDTSNGTTYRIEHSLDGSYSLYVTRSSSNLIDCLLYGVWEGGLNSTKDIVPDPQTLPILLEPFMFQSNQSRYEGYVGRIMKGVRIKCKWLIPTLVTFGTYNQTTSSTTTSSANTSTIRLENDVMSDILPLWNRNGLNSYRLTSAIDGIYQFDLFWKLRDLNLTLTGMFNSFSNSSLTSNGGSDLYLHSLLSSIQPTRQGSNFEQVSTNLPSGFNASHHEYLLTVPFGISRIFLTPMFGKGGSNTIRIDNGNQDYNTTVYSRIVQERTSFFRNDSLESLPKLTTIFNSTTNQTLITEIPIFETSYDRHIGFEFHTLSDGWFETIRYVRNLSTPMSLQRPFLWNLWNLTSNSTIRTGVDMTYNGMGVNGSDFVWIDVSITPPLYVLKDQYFVLSYEVLVNETYLGSSTSYIQPIPNITGMLDSFRPVTSLENRTLIIVNTTTNVTYVTSTLSQSFDAFLPRSPMTRHVYLDILFRRDVEQFYNVTTLGSMFGNPNGTLISETGLPSPVFPLRLEGLNTLRLVSQHEGVYTIKIKRLDLTMKIMSLFIHDASDKNLTSPTRLNIAPSTANNFTNGQYDYSMSLPHKVASLTFSLNWTLIGSLSSQQHTSMASSTSSSVFIDLNNLPGTRWNISSTQSGEILPPRLTPTQVKPIQPETYSTYTILKIPSNSTIWLRLVTPYDGVYGIRITRYPPIVSNVVLNGILPSTNVSSGSMTLLQLSPTFQSASSNSYSTSVNNNFTHVSFLVNFLTSNLLNGGVRPSSSYGNGEDGNGPNTIEMTWYNATEMLYQPSGTMWSPSLGENNLTMVTNGLTMSETSPTKLMLRTSSLFYLVSNTDGIYAFLIVHGQQVVTGIDFRYGSHTFQIGTSTTSTTGSSTTSFLTTPSNFVPTLSPTFVSGLVEPNIFQIGTILDYAYDMVEMRVGFKNLTIVSPSTLVNVIWSNPSETVSVENNVATRPFSIQVGTNTFRIESNIDGSYIFQLQRSIPSITSFKLICLNASFAFDIFGRNLQNLPKGFILDNNTLSTTTTIPSKIDPYQTSPSYVTQFQVPFVVGSILPEISFKNDTIWFNGSSVKFDFFNFTRLNELGLVMTTRLNQTTTTSMMTNVTTSSNSTSFASLTNGLQYNLTVNLTDLSAHLPKFGSIDGNNSSNIIHTLVSGVLPLNASNDCKLSVGLNLLRIRSERDGEYLILIQRYEKNLINLNLIGTSWTGSEMIPLLNTSTTSSLTTTKQFETFIQNYQTPESSTSTTWINLTVPSYVNRINIALDYRTLETPTASSSSSIVASQGPRALSFVWCGQPTCNDTYVSTYSIDNLPNHTFATDWKRMLPLEDGSTSASTSSSTSNTLISLLSLYDGSYQFMVQRRRQILQMFQLTGYIGFVLINSTTSTTNLNQTMYLNQTSLNQTTSSSNITFVPYGWILAPGYDVDPMKPQPDLNTTSKIQVQSNIISRTRWNDSTEIRIPFSIERISIFTSTRMDQPITMYLETQIGTTSSLNMTNTTTPTTPVTTMSLPSGNTTLTNLTLTPGVPTRFTIRTDVDGNFTVSILRSKPSLNDLILTGISLETGIEEVIPFQERYETIPTLYEQVLPTSWNKSSKFRSGGSYNYTTTFGFKFQQIRIHVRTEESNTIDTSIDNGITFQTLLTGNDIVRKGYNASSILIDLDQVSQPSLTQLTNRTVLIVRSSKDGIYRFDLTRLRHGIRSLKTFSVGSINMTTPIRIDSGGEGGVGGGGDVELFTQPETFQPGRDSIYPHKTYNLNLTSLQTILLLSFDLDKAYHVDPSLLEVSAKYEASGEDIFITTTTSNSTMMNPRPYWLKPQRDRWLNITIRSVLDGSWTIRIWTVGGSFRWQPETIPIALYSNELSSSIYLETHNITTPTLQVSCHTNTTQLGERFEYDPIGQSQVSTFMSFQNSSTPQFVRYITPKDTSGNIVFLCTASGPDAHRFDPVPTLIIPLRGQAFFNISLRDLTYPSGQFVFSGSQVTIGISVTDRPVATRNVTLRVRINCEGWLGLTSETQGSCDRDLIPTVTGLSSVPDISLTLTSTNTTVDPYFLLPGLIGTFSHSITFTSPTLSNGVYEGTFNVLFSLGGDDASHFSISEVNSWSYLRGHLSQPDTGLQISVRSKSSFSLTGLPTNMSLGESYTLTTLLPLEDPIDTFARLAGLSGYQGVDVNIQASPLGSLQIVPSLLHFGLPNQPLTFSLLSTSNGYVGISTITFQLSGTDRSHYHTPSGFQVFIVPRDTIMSEGICSNLSLTSSCTFTLVLSHQPFREGRLELKPSMSPDGSITPSSLTFDYLNWYLPQRLTVTAPSSLTSSAFSSGNFIHDRPQISISISSSGLNAFQYEPFQNQSILILSQTRITDLPTSIYATQASQPVTVSWSGLTYGQVGLSIALDPPNFGYVSTSTISYSGELYSQNFLIHAPSLDSSSTTTMTLKFSIIGTDSNKFETQLFLATRTTGTPTYVRGNSFTINVIPQVPLTVSNIPTTLYTLQTSDSPISITLGASVTSGSGGVSLSLSTYLGGVIAGSFLPATPLTFADGSTQTSFTTVFTAPSTHGTVALSFSLTGGDAAHYYITPSAFYTITILQRTSFTFSNNSFPSKVNMDEKLILSVRIGDGSTSSSSSSAVARAMHIDSLEYGHASRTLATSPAPKAGQTIYLTCTSNVGTVTPSSLTFTSTNYGTLQTITFTPPMLDLNTPNVVATLSWSMRLVDDATKTDLTLESLELPATRTLVIINPNVEQPVSSSSSSSGGSSGAAGSSSTGAASTGSYTAGGAAGGSTGGAPYKESTSSGSSGLSTTDIIIVVVVVIALVLCGFLIVLLVWFLRRRKLQQLKSSDSADESSSLVDGSNGPLSAARSAELRQLADDITSSQPVTSYGAAAVAVGVAADDAEERQRAAIRAKIEARARADEARRREEEENSVIQARDEEETSVIRDTSDDYAVDMGEIELIQTQRAPPMPTPMHPMHFRQQRAVPLNQATPFGTPHQQPLPPPSLSRQQTPLSPSTGPVHPRSNPLSPPVSLHMNSPSPVMMTNQPPPHVRRSPSSNGGFGAPPPPSSSASSNREDGRSFKQSLFQRPASMANRTPNYN